MKRLVVVALIIVSLSSGIAATGRSPVAQSAEETFFRAMNKDASLRKTALRELTTAIAVDPTDARTNVLLGLCHLWIAAEGTRVNPEEINNLILAEHYLARAQELNPSDERIPSWFVPARLALNSIEQKHADDDRVYASLTAAFEKNPGFHSFSLALINFRAPHDSQRFRAGLVALRKGLECAEVQEAITPDNPACTNQPRWPHNVEAFNMFAADYLMKAGDAKRARVALEAAKASPGFATWRHAREAEDRLASLEDYTKRYANADPNDDPRPVTTCSSCHAE